MPSIFSKPLNEITAIDVQALVDENYPEDSTVEFKEKLPSKDGDDPWYTGASSISDRARNQILEEVIALANTHGGHVILGIGETEDRPPRAANIMPIPRCDDLAERLQHQLRDLVDPQIPLVRACGVRTDGNSGVVIIRVPQSRMAPHRHKVTLECYYRHADRTERMTMREIQDLTLRISRGLADIEATYKKRSEDFRNRSKAASLKAIRATLIPLSPLYAERVYESYQLFHPWFQFTLTIGSQQHKFRLPCVADNQRPILRGARRYCTNGNSEISQEVYKDGLIEIQFRVADFEVNEIHLEWMLAVVCNGLVMADYFRRGVGSPDVEYGLEFEVISGQSLVKFTGFSEMVLPTRIATHPVHMPCVFPRYSFAGQNSDGNISQLIELIVKDIYDAMGAPTPHGDYNLSWSE